MTGSYFVELQEALVIVFAPIMQWWLTGLVVFGVLTAIFNVFMAMFRWLSK